VKAQLRGQVDSDATKMMELQQRLTDATERQTAAIGDAESTSGKLHYALAKRALDVAVAYISWLK
jgi:hypothetical protein